MKAASIIAAMLALGVAQASADIPERINYQGRLVDGTVLVNDTVEIIFRLWDHPSAGAGSVLYAETQQVVVVDGLYSVHIGASNQVEGAFANCFTNDEVYLELKVDGTTFYPRERLVAVPFAVQAHAVSAGGVTADMLADGTALCEILDDDGTNSLLDADLLDGQDSTMFSSASHGHDASNIVSGMLSTYRYSAISDLDEENRIGPQPYQLAIGSHDHDAEKIVSGTLDDERYSAYADLGAEDRIGSGSGQLAVGTHTHAAGHIVDGTLGTDRYSAFNDLDAEDRIGDEAGQLALGNHDHDASYVNVTGDILDGNFVVSGTMGIGTVSPAEKLEVLGNVKVSGSGKGYVFADGSKQTTAVTGGGTSLPEGAILLCATSNNAAMASAGFSLMGNRWQLTSNNQYVDVVDHEAVVHDGKMWVLSGYYGNYQPYVYFSSDGISWNLTTSAPGWGGRAWHEAVSHDGKLWILGGQSTVTFSDIRWSEDGTNWTLAVSSAPWGARNRHQAVSHDGKMWVLGGYSGSLRNDVWYSTDGTNWTEVTSNAGWTARVHHEAVSHDGKLWVLGGSGGGLRNDVWSSFDGSNWTCVTGAADWTPRYDHEVVSYDGKLLVLGGNDGNVCNDVWYSEDGISWTECVYTGTVWAARDQHEAVIHEDKIWVLGGNTGVRQSDVWYQAELSPTKLGGFYLFTQ